MQRRRADRRVWVLTVMAVLAVAAGNQECFYELFHWLVRAL